MMSKSPFDPDTEYAIVTSESPVTVDGYARNEPKFLFCGACGAYVRLTGDPDGPGVDELSHESTCPQRFARSVWWREQVRE